MNDETNMSAAVPPRSSKSAPDWQLLRDGCPGGESPAEIGARADRSSAECAPSAVTF